MNAVLRALPRAIAPRPNAVDMRTVLKLGSGLGTLALAALAQPALAADECGIAVSGTVTCLAASNPFAAGVTYTLAAPLTVVLNSDTVLTPIAGTAGITLTGDQAATINAAPGSSITTVAAPAITVTTATAPISVTAGRIRTTGDNAQGILTASTTGSTTIVARDTATTGLNSTGIQATTTTGPLLVTTGTVNTTGANANGVLASSTSGNVTVNGGTIGTTGANSVGLLAQTGGAGTATIQGGTITTTGANALGAAALATGTGAAVAAPLSVSTTGANAVGVAAVSSGGTAQAGAATTTVSTTGAGSIGILARGLTGTTVNYASVSTTGDNATGISVPAGGASVAVNGATTGLLSTTGAAADGINVAATNAATVNVGRVSATGAGSRGIVATGGTTATVTSTGVVANGDAVTATGGTGAANVTLSGTNNSVTGTGAVVTGGTTAGLTLTGGTLNGAVNGATLTSATGATVTNSGTIGGTNAAIAVNGAGAATITNNAPGTINGRILLGAGADTVNNAGTFNATAVSDLGAGADVFNNTGTFNATSASTDFGAGADVFNNSGTLNVRPGTAVAGTVTMTGLETFNNNGGLIDLRNGHTGDALILPGTFNGSGASALAVDVNLGTAPTTSDTLQVTGAATGSTAVTFNRLDTGPAVLSNAAGTTIVQAGAGSSANAFVIAPTSQNVGGIIQYGVVYNPTLNTFNLVSAPGAAAYRTALFGEGVRNLWLQSGDAWSAHMRELRDNIAANGPGASGGRFWFQGFGQWERRRNLQTFSFNGLTNTFDQGYDQDYYGFQLGMDLGAPVGDEGGFNFGVTGGYQNSTMSFANTADRLKLNAVNGGVYASFTSGIFFVNALGKYDYYWGENISPAGLYRADVNGSVWGAKAEAGLRFGHDLFIEPAVSVSWTNSDFDDLGLPSGNFAIDDEDGLRGKAGARVGYVTQMGAAKVTIYGGANYVREFRGRSNVVFTSGGQTVAFRSPYNNDYVEGTLGVNIGSEAGKLSGFFEGRYSDGRDYDGFGARGGVRVRF